MIADEQNVGIRMSLLDRLTDSEPDATKEAPMSSWEELRQYKNSLCRDLAALLNTRRAQEDFDPNYEQASASLLTYGIIDFTSYNLKNDVDQELVRRSIERSIRQFEPRLTRVTVNMDELDSLRSVLRFQVKALLRTQGNSENVLFDVSLHRESRRIAVTGANS
jgi:type VI secretion system protein ImpF